MDYQHGLDNRLSLYPDWKFKMYIGGLIGLMLYIWGDKAMLEVLIVLLASIFRLYFARNGVIYERKKENNNPHGLDNRLSL